MPIPIRSFVRLILPLLLVAPPFAHGAQRTFVSTTGLDTNGCTLAAPCRQFAKAITVTDPGGELVVLDSGGYGSVTIDKNATIVSPPGVYAGVSVFAGNDGITVAAPATSVVIRGLTINGQGGNNGVRVQSGSVHVENVVISNMLLAGILVEGGATVRISNTIARSNADGLRVAPGVGAVSVLVRDSEFASNSVAGIGVSPAVSGASAQVTVERTSIVRNGDGIHSNAGASVSANVVVTQSVTSENTGAGVLSTGSTSTVFIRESAITRNGTGMQQTLSGTLHACGGNLLVANTSAQSGVIDTGSCLDVLAMSGPAGGDLTGAYPNPTIASSAVTASKIAAGAVGNSELALGAVTASRIASNTITGSQIAAGAIGSSEIAAAAVGTTQLANDSVTRGKIAGGYSNGAISLAVPGNSCADANVGVPGAQTGDIPLLAFQSGGGMPQNMSLTALQTPSAGLVTVRVCNFAGSMQSFSNVPIYLITLR